jgi:hypothetical protein
LGTGGRYHFSDTTEIGTVGAYPTFSRASRPLLAYELHFVYTARVKPSHYALVPCLWNCSEVVKFSDVRVILMELSAYS